MKLTLNISPCPNDTYMFDAMINGRIDTEGLEFDVHFEDIENLNRNVMSTRVDISKISYAIMPQIVGRYKILNSGSALGFGNGPLLVTRKTIAAEQIDLSDGELEIVVPGKYTTANLLISRLFPQITHKSFLLFSQIADQVANGTYDAGVLIHEGRFTYSKKGLQLVADLGQLWEQHCGLPLPLGAIVVAGDLPLSTQKQIERVLQKSIEYAMKNPGISKTFVKQHAQELDDHVIDQHIAMFVNKFSVSLGVDGRKAVAKLIGITDQTIFV